MDVEIEGSIALENLDRVCRVCLSTDGNNQYIFQDDIGEKEVGDTFTLSQKLQVYGGIEIWKDDGLPSKICTPCISKIRVAHDFRDQCQKADEKLRILCGKSPGKGNLQGSKFDSFKDQDCQTDTSSLCTPVKKELSSAVKEDFDKIKKENILNTNSYPNSVTSTEALRDTCQEDIEIHEHKILLADDLGPCRSIEKEKTSFKKDSACRSRRIAVFKRITSIQNLKSHRERQRQYIKKNPTSRSESNDQEFSNRNIRKRAIRPAIINFQAEFSHKCNKCSRSYATKTSLERHMLTHNDKKFKCDKCRKHFVRLDKLIEHGKLHDPEVRPNPVSCKICDKNFRKTDTMVRHLNVHKKANPKEVFSILKDIRDKRRSEDAGKHEKRLLTKEESSSGDETETMETSGLVPKSTNSRAYNPESPNSDSHSSSEPYSLNSLAFYRCKHCTKCYSTNKSLQRHMLIHDEKKFVCNVCNMKFFRPDRLKSHRDRYGHDEDKECMEPQKPPDDKSAIKLINSWIREQLDSDNEGKGFPCDVCGKSYVTKKSLQKHRANMHASKTNICTVCGEDCKCLEKSNNDDNKIDKSKPYSCDECDKSFEKESKLKTHLRIHERAKEQQDSNFKRFLCHICSKTFRQNTGLMFHMRTHTGYKPHVCKYCGRGFTSNSNCINHERTHTGDRPFVCHFCSAAFAKSCTLKAHITTHTGEANYHCKTCGKSFRRLKYLKEHSFTHTGEKPYACKICGTAYSHSGSLFVHEKKCKAQYSNYQNVSSQNTQNYVQLQTGVNVSPIVAPIIPMLSASSNLNNVNNTLGSHGQKSYIENMQRMSAHAAAAAAVGNPGLHMHSNSDVSEMASAVRSFTITQVFHS
ncbi:zinc finger protein 271-like [Athalia rosae]|uniref:zinc finger protein 271-like n=1 Tax=Athalia rosae TaxID=37344 RepID=UPI002034175E|nr:zinc finger protein 271-like [Athalia rosae]